MNITLILKSLFTILDRSSLEGLSLDYSKDPQMVKIAEYFMNIAQHFNAMILIRKINMIIYTFLAFISISGLNIVINSPDIVMSIIFINTIIYIILVTGSMILSKSAEEIRKKIYTMLDGMERYANSNNIPLNIRIETSLL